MRTKLVAVALLVGQASCSLGIRKVDDNWDGTTEPDCSDSILPVVADGFASAVGLGIATIGIEEENDTAVAVGLLIGAVFLVPGIIGEGRVRDCREAKATWRVGGAVGRAAATEMREREPDADEIAARREQEAVARQRQQAAQASAATPRGFFCASSASAVAAGLCAREKESCARARDAALAVITDMTECTLVETAHCFDAKPGDQRCSPTAESCTAQRERAGVPNECRQVQ